MNQKQPIREANMQKYLNIVNENQRGFSCNVVNDIQLLLIKCFFVIKCNKLTDFCLPDLTVALHVAGSDVHHRTFIYIETHLHCVICGLVYE